MIILDGDPIAIEPFPNGEMRIPIRQIKDVPQHVMTLRYRNDTDLLTMAFLKSHLDSQCERCRLVIEYLPYSRMDRCNPEFVFTLKPVTDLINRLNFDRVTLIEPHSDVSTALLNRCTAHTYSDQLFKAVIRHKINFGVNDCVMFPDAGAQKRYGSKCGDYFVVTGDKMRDFKTGKITEIKLSRTNVDCDTAVIVDDLCSYGGTFVMAAKALRARGVHGVYLVVTHCEKSIFKGALLKDNLIDHVYTTNILFDEEDIPKEFKNKITIIAPMETL